MLETSKVYELLKKALLGLLVSVIFLFSLLLILILPHNFISKVPNLVLWLPFDGDLKDYSGNGYHGQAVGNIEFCEGIKGKALLLKGDGFVFINDTHDFSIVNNPNGMTISFWICPSTNSFKTANKYGYIRFLGKSDVRKHEWCFTIYNANASDRPYRISFYIHNATGGLGIGAYFQEPWNIDEWIFITGVIQNGVLKIYKNGIYKHSSYNYSEPNPIGRIIPKDTDSPLCIGKRCDVEEYFEGKVDDFRIYNRALNDTEIKSLYSSSHSLTFTHIYTPMTPITHVSVSHSQSHTSTTKQRVKTITIKQQIKVSFFGL